MGLPARFGVVGPPQNNVHDLAEDSEQYSSGKLYQSEEDEGH